MTPENRTWIETTAIAAGRANHIFPAMAASEAALESEWGQSALFRDGLNAFGMKQHKHPIYGTLNLPTKEYLGGEWEVVEASWVKYDTLEECFEDRMATLKRLQNTYPHYAAALAATDAVTFVTEVSKTWSSDPNRASKVIAIYTEWVVTQVPPAPDSTVPG